MYSLIEIDDQVREKIRTGASEQEIEAAALQNGFLTLERSARSLVESGITTLDEAERAVGKFQRTPALAVAHSVGTTVGATAAAHPAISKRRVLIVDDDENIRVVMSMVLTRELFDVVEASNGYEGLEKVFSAPPEIILCDLMMPELDGHGLVQRLKSDPRTKSIPVIMLTANDTEESEHRLITSGADDFLSKTTNPKIIVARMNRLLQRD